MRRDDGAGLVLAESIERIWREQRVSVRHVSVHQLTPELAADMSEPDVSAVVFVDACAAEDGADLIPTLRPLTPAVDVSPTIGHHLDPELLLVYTDRLYGKTPPCWIITIPGVDFGVGDALSEPVRQALAASESLIAEWRCWMPAQ
jgi:hydrogenase maturation protease